MNTEDFIKGFRELREKMPRISVSGYQNQNCPYGNAIYNSKNCYVCFDMDVCEGCMYCGLTNRSRFCCDCEDTWDSELCYECFEVYNCYSCDFSQFMRDCSDCAYSFDLLNCHNCFGCVGLRRANYHIFNEKFSPEEYKTRVAHLKKQPRESIIARVLDLRLQYPHLASRQYQAENCFGDNIQNSRNLFYGFNCKSVFDGAYLWDIYTTYTDRNEDSYDSFFAVDLRGCYENIQIGDAWNCNYINYCEHIKDAEFAEACFNSRYLFGCIFVNRREYLILNQPYEKEAWVKETAALRDALKKAGKYSWDVFE